jgi:hypothetical protein
MRKLVILFTFFTTINSSGQTSVYHPFPDSNAVWNYFLDPICAWMGYTYDNYSIIFDGDTTINSQTYHKLNTPFIDYYYTGQCTPVTYFIGYRGAIRQDTSLRKVFYVPPSESTEQLLYDFNMQVGDTVQGYLAYWSGGGLYDTIVAIDSVLVGNSYRKRWQINYCYDVYLIEGIGSTYGLIEILPQCLPDHWYYSLTCFKQNEQSLYPDPNYNCQLINSVNEIENINLTIFPNPSSGSLFIKTDLLLNEIKIFDLVGNIVFHKNQINQSHLTVDDLPNGTYFISVTDKNKNSYYSKIICSH